MIYRREIWCSSYFLVRPRSPLLCSFFATIAVSSGGLRDICSYEHHDFCLSYPPFPAARFSSPPAGACNPVDKRVRSSDRSRWGRVGANSAGPLTTFFSSDDSWHAGIEHYSTYIDNHATITSDIVTEITRYWVLYCIVCFVLAGYVCLPLV